MIILGIESSCDETAAAVVKVSRGKFIILSNVVRSQIKIHKQYGGVVPEVAARNHIENILPVIDKALKDSGVSKKQLNRVAVTYGPGLITSLMVGVQTAKTLAYMWDKPLLGINHIKAHIYAAYLQNTKIKFPALALVVSGGHTELIIMKDKTSFKKIGQTLDDAAGEAFDKVGKLLNLGFPGGPEVSRHALTGNNKAYKLPRPMMHSKDFDFSFSGLKTAVMYAKAKSINDMSASFQQAVVDVLVAKTLRAAHHYKTKTVVLAGGVAANHLLRETLAGEMKKIRLPFIVPNARLCTDNAAMIAAAGYFSKSSAKPLVADPNLDI